MPPSSINVVCPYYTMFPLEFPLRVLKRYGRFGGWVLDPFCGRGTTNYASRLLGLPSVGVDSSPVATALAMAKLPRVCAQDIVAATKRILQRRREVQYLPSGEFWRRAYHPTTLLDICRLRESFLRKCETNVKHVLRAIIMGALHGPITKVLPSYLSNQCTRTFSPKPAYAVRYWKAKRLHPPKVDVLAVIERRANRFLTEQTRSGKGWVTRADVREPSSFPNKKFTCVVTSPPYYGMRTYIPDQWLRYWFVGGPAKVVYEQPALEIHHHSADEFVEQLGQVWSNVRNVCTPDASIIIRFGGIRDRKKQEPLELLRSSLRDGGLKIVTAKAAGNARDGKRQAQQFGIESEPMMEWDIYAKVG